ncbi:hypothetical protein EVAR_8215_1 [Eumeta japonica]|uniref:Uncharacterized protein n=1 Tax=Eumeta variegata TaxID=151549 RepID=A0A4C1TFL9_EUMVA|nr:hypothetical protein EVAR_8215_1 [Eumeta japonica]
MAVKFGDDVSAPLTSDRFACHWRKHERAAGGAVHAPINSLDATAAICFNLMTSSRVRIHERCVRLSGDTAHSSSHSQVSLTTLSSG